MGCKFSEYGTSKCQIFDGSIEMLGVNEEGVCICQDDPDPTLLCEEYEEV